VQGLTDEQAALTPTVSALCLGGLIKHLTHAEKGWINFVLHGAEALSGGWEQHMGSFRMEAGETLADLLAEYDAVAKRTDDLVSSLPDLDQSRRCPRPRGSSRRQLDAAPRSDAHHRRDRAARRPRRHHPPRPSNGQKTMG